MTEVAHASINIDLNDAEAIAGLRAVDAQFDRTMRDIDRKKAVMKIEGDTKPLEKDLAKAKKLADDYEKKVAAQQNKGAQAGMKKKLERMRLDETAHRTALQQAREELAATKNQVKAEAQQDRARAAAASAQARQHRATIAQANELQRQRNRAETDERRMMKLHSDAAVMDRKLTRERITGAAREEAQIARLQERYRKLAIERQKIDRRATKLHTLASPEARQRVDIDRHNAVVEMEALRAELEVMGRKPIEQKIDLDTNKANNALANWLKGINDTAVRVGPITTSVAGLGRGLLLLGPIISGLVGQIGALTAVIGSGLAGAVGIAGGALAGFGVSLGGVGLLIPSLLRDFKNLNTLQKAYHVQVLKTGVNSDKAKKKLAEFQHALRTVGEPARRAFNALDGLQNRWRAFAKSPGIRANFFNDLTAGLDVINHHFDFFKKNTTAAFDAVSTGWQDWMDRLKSDSAGGVLATLGKNANASIRPLMRGLGNLGAAFGKIAASFSRWLPNLSKGFLAWSANLNNTVSDAHKLNPVVDQMVHSFKDLVHFLGAAGRFLVALFEPAVKPGQNMLESWTRGLDRTAESMRTVKREQIKKFFEDAIVTANKFWTALKPLAQIFFEWSTVMKPFTDVALTFFKILGDGLQTVLDFGPTKGVFQAAFAVFLTSAVIQRARGIGTAIWSIAKGIGAIKAAGGLGAALKGGISKMFNPLHGVRGMTPATPMFVKEVGLGGAGGAPVPGKGGGGGLLGKAAGVASFALPRLTGLAAGYAAFALLINKTNIDLSHTAQKLDDLMDAPRGSARFKQIQELTRGLEQANKAGDTKKMHEIADQIREIAKTSNSVNGAGMKNLADEIDQAASKKSLPELNMALTSVKNNFAALANTGTVHMRQIRNTVSMNMRTIQDRLGKDSEEGRHAMAVNFKLAADAVRNRMREMGHNTKEGMALIKQYTIAGMKAMGLTNAQANAKFKTETLKNSDDRPGAATIPGVHKAHGGLMQVGRKGERGPDNVPMNLGGVPAVVGRGEQIAVFNHHQQKRFARSHPGGLEGFFAGKQPRHGFEAGGIVALGRELQREGYAVSENPAFGGVSGVHAPNSYHYRGMAIDVNADNFPGGEKSALDKLYNRLKGMSGVIELLWQVAGHFDHLHVAMAGGANGILGGVAAPKIDGAFTNMPGAPGVMANRAMEVARNAGQAVVDQVASTMAIETGGESNPGGGAATRAQMVAWARQALSITQPQTGWGPTAANIANILTLAMKESGWVTTAVNRTDINAQQGNPSGGLMQVTLDKFGGDMGAMLNPLQNIVASIMYQFKRYGRLVTFSPYGEGGLATMGQSAWKRGGKVDKPTLMTGEDGKAHPEFVVGSNPQFRKSNVSALRAAARKLGVPMARESTKHRDFKPLRNTGADVDNLPYVKDYARWQTAEDDKQREISIAQRRVHEPDSLIKENGKDASGEMTYIVDQKAIDTYKGQMEVVTKLYGELVGSPKGAGSGPGGIMGELLASGRVARKKLEEYRFARDQNITQIRAAIARDERLLHSRDKDTRKHAQSRLENNRALLGEQIQKKQDAGTKRGDIGDDMHDARFRAVEYGIDRDDVLRDIAAVDPRAAADVASNNPQADTSGGGSGTDAVDPTAQHLAGLDAELALEKIGQGMNGQTPRAEADILGDMAKDYQSQIDQGKAMLADTDPTNDMDAYSLISSAASALQGIQAELAKFDPATNAAAFASAARSTVQEFGNNFTGVVAGATFAAAQSTAAMMSPFRGRVRSPIASGGMSGGFPINPNTKYLGGGAGVVINNTFATVPPDPHTWSKGVAFEIGAAL